MPYFLADLWKTDLETLEGEELWEHLERCLTAHDWTFDYSDDHGVWMAGLEQLNHLQLVREKCEDIDTEKSNDLYFHHSPFRNDDGTLIDR